MKKILVLSFFVIFLFSGCELFNLQMPEKVSVKTKAEYNFSIISVKADETEIDIPKIVNGQIPEGFPLRIYDYNPGKNQTTQQYLVEYKLSKEIDLSGMLKDFDKDILNIEITDGLPTVEFKVPEISIEPVEKAICDIDADTIIPEINETYTFPTEGEGIVKIPSITLSGIEHCVIGEGSSLSFEITAEEWDDLNVTWNNISLEGGITIPNNKFDKTGATCSASLEDVELKSGETKIFANVTVCAKNANLKNPPKVKVTPIITKIKSVEISLPTGLPFTKNDIELPEKLTDYISEVEFGDSTITVSYENGLPEGNDIALICSSDFLNLNDTQPLTSGVTTFTADRTSPDLSEKIDFKVNVSNVTNPVAGKIRVKNVVTNQTYSFKVTEVKFEPKINSVTIGLPSDVASYLKDSLDTGFNPNSEIKKIKEAVKNDTVSSLIDSVKLDQISAYLFVKKPNVLQNLEISGTAAVGTKANKSVTSLTNPVYILGTESENGTIKLVDNFPSLGVTPTDENPNPTVEKDISAEKANASFYLEKLPAHDILLTSDDKNLFLDYDLNIGADNKIKVTWDEIDTLLTDKAINLELAAYVSVSLAFKFNKENPSDKDPFVISLNDFLDNELVIEKIMDTPPEDLQIYLDAIKEVSLIYNTKLPLKITNLDNKEDDMKLTAKIDFTDGSDSIVQEPLTLKHGEITVKDGQIMSLLTKEFKPSLSISIPQGTYYVPRGMNMYADLSIQIKTDGTISFDDVMGGNQL